MALNPAGGFTLSEMIKSTAKELHVDLHRNLT